MNRWLGVLAGLLVCGMAWANSITLPGVDLVGISRGEDCTFVREEPRGTWERCECEICGKTIWERVEWTGMASFADSVSMYDITGQQHNIAEKLRLDATWYLCQHCADKYRREFKDLLIHTARDFITKAGAKESDRRRVVAEQNTQEAIRRLEVQIKDAAEQIRKLNEQLQPLKETKGK